MGEFTYTSNPGSLKEFFKEIQEVGVPAKLTQKVLESLGYKSNNDRPIISVMKAIGFIDQSGVPTENWKRFRDKSIASGVLAAAVRTAYADLFTIYPDAPRKDQEALRNFFSSRTNLGERAVQYMVRTFTILCELCDFEAVLETTNGHGQQVVHVAASVPGPSSGQKKTIPAMAPIGGMTVNVNIQLVLPTTEDATIYERLFEAMRKSLIQP